jgi:acetolactate synthase-1/2/3 large subunit
MDLPSAGEFVRGRRRVRFIPLRRLTGARELTTLPLTGIGRNTEIRMAATGGEAGAGHKLGWCGAHVLARALQRHGVEVMFGQSLPSALHLVAPEFGIRQIAYRTENAGASMADGYARISHKVGVVTGQNGPAAALLVSGLAEALKASVPVVALVQDVRRTQTDRNAFQDLDHPELFRACAKWVRRVGELSRIDDYVDMAFTAAASGRPGPAVLLCPQDLLQEKAPGGPTTARR